MFFALVWILAGVTAAIWEAPALKARGSRLEIIVFAALLTVGTLLNAVLTAEIVQFSIINVFYSVINPLDEWFKAL